MFSAADVAGAVTGAPRARERRWARGHAGRYASETLISSPVVAAPRPAAEIMREGHGQDRRNPTPPTSTRIQCMRGIGRQRNSQLIHRRLRDEGHHVEWTS
jgi:hypothetical protein